MRRSVKRALGIVCQCDATVSNAAITRCYQVMLHKNTSTNQRVHKTRSKSVGITANNRWKYSETLRAPAVFETLRQFGCIWKTSLLAQIMKETWCDKHRNLAAWSYHDLLLHRPSIWVCVTHSVTTAIKIIEPLASFNISNAFEVLR